MPPCRLFGANSAINAVRFEKHTAFIDTVNEEAKNENGDVCENKFICIFKVESNFDTQETAAVTGMEGRLFTKTQQWAKAWAAGVVNVRF